MKKFIKISLIVVGLLVVISAGTLYYFLEVKEYDVADEEVDKVVEDPYSIEFPDETPLPETIQRDEEGLVVVDNEGNFILEDGSVMTVKEWFSSDEYQQASTAAVSSGSENDAESDSDQTSAVASAGSNKENDPSDEASNQGTSGNNGSGEENDSDSSAGSDSNSGNTGSGSGSTGNANGSGNSDSGSADPENVVTVETIKSRYENSFNSLAGQASSQLGALIGQAKSEYATKKSNGESINYAYFYQKYSNAATSVEAKTDSAFNSLYSALETELTANGYSATHAESFRSEYEATKKSTRNAIMSEVSGL